MSLSAIAAPAEPKQVAPSWNAPLGIATLISSAVMAGLLAIACFLGHPEWLAGLSALAFIGIWKKRDRGQTQSMQATRVTGVAPSPTEFTLAAVASTFPVATTGLMGFMFYGICYWGTRLVALVLNLFGLGVAPDASSIAFYPTVFVLVVFGLTAAVLQVSKIQRALYPETADGRSAFYALAAQSRLKVAGLILAVVLPVVLILVLFVFRVEAWWPYVLLQIAVFYCAAPTAQVTRQSGTVSASPRIEEAVAMLFRAADYHVTIAPASPSTDDLGPLLAGIDLIAERSGGAYAVQIARGDSGEAERADIIRASNLQTTAWSLSGYRERLGIRAEQTRPIMVMAGRNAGARLKDFCARHGITLIEISNDALRVIETSEREGLSALAAELLSPLTSEAGRVWA